METRSQFMRTFLPHLREDLAAHAQASSDPGEGWFVPIGGRLLPAPPAPIPSRVVDVISRSSGTVRVGEKAPPFTLRTTPDQSVSLDDFVGDPIVLAFYPADWSPVCSDQMVLYNELLPEFAEHNAVILGISVDNVWCHQAFSRDRMLSFPLLADFEPKGTVARAYGVYREKDGLCERALFLLDPEGILRWTYVSPIGVNPGAAGILRALESLRAARRAAA
ncbi:MAG TPA: redoxin domain-containing protein [Acidobacteriaceae bacterium]|jgi:peroxiredoxin